MKWFSSAFSVAAMVAVILAGCTSVPTGKTYNKEVEAEFTILYQANREATLEPCGCHSKPWGGMDRELNALNEIRKGKVPTLFVDAGNMLANSDKKLTPDQKRAKAKAVMPMIEKLGLEAFAPGANDYALGIPFLKELAAKTAFPFVSTNVVDANGKSIFQNSLLIEKAGIKFGIMSVTAKNAFTEAGVQIQDPKAAVEAALPQLAKDADFIILLSQLGLQGDQDLAKQFPQVRLVVGADRSVAQNAPLWYKGQTLHVDGAEQGYMVNTLSVHLGLPFKGFYNLGEITQNKAWIESLEKSIADKKDVDVAQARLKELKENSSLEIYYGGSAYEATLIPLSKEKYGKPNAITKMIKAERERIRKEALTE